MTSKLSDDDRRRKILELHDWYTSSLRVRNRDQILSGLQDRLNEEVDPELRMVVYSVLIAECTLQSNREAALAGAEAQAREFPDESLAWITLSEIYIRQCKDSALALSAIENAVVVARATGKFRRQALQTKARILREIEKFSDLEKCLMEIVREPFSIGIDIAKEDDFFVNLPSGAISSETERTYREYMLST